MGFFYGAFAQSQGFDGHETQKLAHNKVYYHLLGTEEKEDILIQENTEPKDYRFSVKVTHDGKYALLFKTLNGSNREKRLMIAELLDNPAKKELQWQTLFGEKFKKVGLIEYVHNIGTKFYLRTNYKASNQRLIMIDLATFDSENPK